MDSLSKILLTSVLTLSFVNAMDWTGTTMKILDSVIKESSKEQHQKQSKQTDYSYSSINDYEKIKLPLSMKKYINDEVCSKVMNKHYYINCYNYDYLGSTAVYYKLDKQIMNSGNIIERPSTFDTDKELPVKYRTYQKDYTNNIYDMDRGHVISNDSMNHNEIAQKSTFIMSNVVPMLDVVNRGDNSWKGIEMFEREMTQKYSVLEVLNIVYYSDKPEYMKNKIAIPEAFGKILFNKDKNYKKCFYVKNEKPRNRKIEDLEVDCKKLNWEMN